VKPPDPNIDTFEVWVARTVGNNEAYQHMLSAADSPAYFSIFPDANGAVSIIIRTVMKNGLKGDLKSSPSCAAQVWF
jgi:hypothetical protein